MILWFTGHVIVRKAIAQPVCSGWLNDFILAHLKTVKSSSTCHDIEVGTSIFPLAHNVNVESWTVTCLLALICFNEDFVDNSFLVWSNMIFCKSHTSHCFQFTHWHWKIRLDHSLLDTVLSVATFSKILRNC